MKNIEDLRINLETDAMTSRDEVNAGLYPHADRNLEAYRMLIPFLDEVTVGLLQNLRKIRCLDAGCGTGRAAAELSLAYQGKIDMTGVTLVYHPPIQNHASLLPEQTIISSIGEASFGPQGFHLILAVGSIDTSDTVVEEGRRLLDALASPGVLLFAPTTYVDKAEISALNEAADKLHIWHNQFPNRLRKTVYMFVNK